MADEQKPVVAPEAPVVEPTPVVAAAPAVDPIADKPTETVEPKVEETPKTEGEAAAATEEKKDEKPEEKPVEPIYSGALGYKAPGLKNAFRFSKKYFWFGSEEPVSTQSLSQYLRGEKAEVAHPTAAWSSQTGKGLLYFVKHADQKETPAGVLNLADATDLSKDGVVAFFFKLHGHKHTFEAQTLPERNGWFVAFEKAIQDAATAKSGIVESEGYKEELTKLGKPATLAATAAKESSTPKKSTDVTPKPVETEAAAASASAAPARTGSSSSSSSSSDEEKKKKKKAKSKSRSVSRGKRASIFGGFLGKKDKAEEKKEEKKDETEAKKEEEETATPAPTTEATTGVSATAPVITSDIPNTADELKTEEAPVIAAAPATEEKKVEEEKPKPTKRGSIFGNFVEKLRSPTSEKKESDVLPAPPAKDTEVAAEAPKVEDPKTEETPAIVAPTTEATTDAPKVEEAKPTETKPTATTPHKEKQHFSFGKFLGGGKEKVKSPTTEKAPELPETATTEETPAPVVAAPVEPAAEAPKEEEKKEEETPAGNSATASAAPAPKAKRGSIFGNLTGSVKKEKEGEAGEKPQGLKGLFRNASKAGRSKKDKEATTTPAKVEESTEPKEEKVDEAVKPEEKEETPAAPAAEPVTIGDVVPDAVSVGQAPKSTPQVSTTA